MGQVWSQGSTKTKAKTVRLRQSYIIGTKRPAKDQGQDNLTKSVSLLCDGWVLRWVKFRDVCLRPRVDGWVRMGSGILWCLPDNVSEECMVEGMFWRTSRWGGPRVLVAKGEEAVCSTSLLQIPLLTDPGLVWWSQPRKVSVVCDKLWGLTKCSRGMKNGS